MSRGARPSRSTRSLRRAVIIGCLLTGAVATPTHAFLEPADDDVIALDVPLDPVEPIGGEVVGLDADVPLSAPDWAWPEVAGKGETVTSLAENCGLPFRIGLPWPGYGQWYQICVTDNFRYYIRRLSWTF